MSDETLKTDSLISARVLTTMGKKTGPTTVVLEVRDTSGTKNYSMSLESLRRLSRHLALSWIALEDPNSLEGPVGRYDS